MLSCVFSQQTFDKQQNASYFFSIAIQKFQFIQTPELHEDMYTHDRRSEEESRKQEVYEDVCKVPTVMSNGEIAYISAIVMSLENIVNSYHLRILFF